MGNRSNTSDDFIKKVKFTKGCWIWKASTSHGYGHFGQAGKVYRAHKYLFELCFGKVPKGYELDHKCRNRACVNPNHLEVVTRLVNVQRGDAGKHWRDRTHCKNGHKYTKSNTRIRIGKYGSKTRICLICLDGYRKKSFKKLHYDRTNK